MVDDKGNNSARIRARDLADLRDRG